MTAQNVMITMLLLFMLLAFFVFTGELRFYVGPS